MNRLFLIAFGAAIAGGPSLHGAQPWARPDLPFRIRVDVRTTARNSPVPIDVDFSAPGRVDADSITVIGDGGRVPIYVSDPVADFGKGMVYWVAREPGAHGYYAYFDTLGHGKRPFRDYQEPVGAGDSFHYNVPGGFQPLGIGMDSDQPVAVDWDGDGRVDLIQRNLYSYAYGQPYWGLFFWRNIGTNQSPKFDRYVRLQAEGKYIGDVYNEFQVVDWDGDGKPDVLYGIGGGKQRGVMRVYRNTGTRDSSGLPVLTVGPEVPRTGGGDLGYGMRLLDWTGGARPDLFTLRRRVEYFPEQVANHSWYRHPRLPSQDGQPRFGPGEALSLAGKTVYEERPTDLYDWDGDGDLDIIGATDDLHTKPPQTSVVVWENTGTRQAPEFKTAPRRIADVGSIGCPLPTAVDGPAFRGLLLTYMGGWLRYLERARQGLRSKLTDRGVLLARGQACSSGGYDSVEVADWDGDGDLDFIVGNELGYLQLIENISRGGRTMFAAPRLILLANGEPMHVARWNFLNDADPERNLGQSKPTYVDWDGDGDLDLLVGNNANRIACFENIGTRTMPRFAPMRKLMHDSGEHFSFRKRPVAVDWNGDGLPDLVAGYSGAREKVDPDGYESVCLFLRYRGTDGKLHLRDGVPFRLVDGSEFRLPIPYRNGFEAADWNGDGKTDLFTNEGGRLFVYVNEGSNSSPVFRKQPLKMFGEPIQLSHHETSIKVVDWDRDGAPDLVLGGESGWIYYFRRAALDLDRRPEVRVGALEARPGRTGSLRRIRRIPAR